MRPPSVSVRHTSSPDLKDLKDDDPNSAGLALWNRWATEDVVAYDDRHSDIDATMEEDAIRFFELPVESTGGRRRRLLAQFCENTKHLDAWLRRVEPPAPLPEASDVSEASSSSRRPPFSRKWPRQMLIKGSVRKGYGIRKPRSHAELSEELHLSREEDDMMVQWESRWREQELEHQREEARARSTGVWCRTPSFGAEAASPSSEQDDFADEVRAICGDACDASLEFAAPEGKQRVTITLPCSPLLAMAEDEEDEISKHEMSREERLMRFCPEVVNPAFSQEVKAVLQKSLVRGASKVLAEHRGHRRNCERFRKAGNEESVIDDQGGLRLAMHLHARTQQHYRRGCPATPPLQGITLRPGSVARQSPDFSGLRQALPGKTAIIAANRKRKKPARQVQSVERGTRDRPSVTRSNSPHLFEPVPCSFECRNWRAPSPLQVRLEEEEMVVGSQWRDFLEELRLNRCYGRKPKQAKAISRKQTAQELEMSDEEQLKSKESLESGKVQDCPDAHAYHLVRQGRLEALERWGGLQFVRPSMLRQLLFYVARSGSVRMLQLLLDEMRKNHPDALHWREQGGAAAAAGATLLHAAAEADMLTMCVLLEDLGADLEATDQNGKRPWEVAGPFCAETFNNYGSFRGDDRSPFNSTLRLTSTLQTISEKTMSRTTTRRLSNTQSGRFQ